MKKSAHFGLILLFAPFAAFGSVAISGRIEGADSTTPILAHVHLSSIGGSYRTPLESIQVAKNGRFELELEAAGMYRLWVTAVNHSLMSIPLVLESGNDKIDLQIRLAPYPYQASFEEVKIIGDWNDYSFRTAELMEKQADGTFVYEAEVVADTLGYQLIGIVEGGRSVNGTMADHFAYDGGGDYKSVLMTRGEERVRIVFDPEQLRRVAGDDLPSVIFDRYHSDLTRIFRIDKDVDRNMDEYRIASVAYREEHGTADGFEFDWLPMLTSLTGNMGQNQPLIVREFAAINLARLSFFTKLEASILGEMLDLVPPDSPLWSMALRSISAVALSHDPENPDAFLRQLVDSNPNRTVQAVALAQLAWLASRQGEDERFRSLYDELKSRYSDVSEIRFELKELNPDKRIAPGKPVPHFEVTLMEDQKVVSRETLLGSFYLMDFWATWCGPCVAEMPLLHQTYDRFKDRNFTILSLSFDAEPEDVQEFRKGKWQMPWLHTFVEGGFKSDIARDFEVMGIPKPILVDPQGDIIATGIALRGENLEKTLLNYLTTSGSDD